MFLQRFNDKIFDFVYITYNIYYILICGLLSFICNFYDFDMLILVENLIVIDHFIDYFINHQLLKLYLINFKINRVFNRVSRIK